jgi:cysteine desulfurase
MREARGPAHLVSVSAQVRGSKAPALIVRGGVERPLEGGGQERGVRAGTVNVAGAVAMGCALRITVEQRADDVARVTRLRDRLFAGLADSIDGLFENGERAVKVAGSCHIGIPGVDAETLLVALDRAGVCAAAGSSCSSGATEPSHVLAAMGVPRGDALSSIRLSLGFASTDQDVDTALELVPATVDALRGAALAAP